MPAVDRASSIRLSSSTHTPSRVARASRSGRVDEGQAVAAVTTEVCRLSPAGATPARPERSTPGQPRTNLPSFSAFQALITSVPFAPSTEKIAPEKPDASSPVVVKKNRGRPSANQICRDARPACHGRDTFDKVGVELAPAVGHGSRAAEPWDQLSVDLRSRQACSGHLAAGVHPEPPSGWRSVAPTFTPVMTFAAWPWFVCSTSPSHHAP